MSDVTYDIKVSVTSAVATELASDAQKVEYTDPLGNVYALDAGGLVRAAKAAGAVTYASYTFTTSSFEVTYYAHNSNTPLADDALTQAKKDLTATGKTYEVYATGANVTRLSLTNPAADGQSFTTAFGGAGTTAGTHYNQKVKIASVTWTNNNPVFSAPATIYYSISGNTTNTTPSTGVADEYSRSTAGAIVISIQAQ